MSHAAAAAAAAAATAAAAAAAAAATAAADAAAAAATAAAAAANAAAAAAANAAAAADAAADAAAAAAAAASIAEPTTHPTPDRVPPMSPHTPAMCPQTPASNSSNSTSVVMSVEEKFRIVRSVGEECIQEDELLNLLTKKPEPVCYDGFEPSGRMHIAQGIMKIISVNKLTSAGCKVKILIADFFAFLNNKMGGDMKKIQTVGQYMIEIWKAGALDLEGDKVEFLWSSEEIYSGAREYWPLVMDIAVKNSLARLMRCVQIMGRSEQDELQGAQILYPCMQCADIFFLKADICQLGMDQRKVNVLAREYCDDIKRKNKPIILSHHMLPGLQQGKEKMSKS